jgi:hypothetical protein
MGTTPAMRTGMAVSALTLSALAALCLSAYRTSKEKGTRE